MPVKTALLAIAMLFGATGIALAQSDAITGKWKTENGTDAEIASCAAGYCITLTSGDHAGREIGQMAFKSPNLYEGKVTDPADDKTYSGKAELAGNGMKLSGCVLVFCQTQSWTRQ